MSSDMAVDYDGLIPTMSGSMPIRGCGGPWSSGHPSYLDWWQDRGRTGSKRPSLSAHRNRVDQEGWAKFGYVRMPEYRWGILWRRRSRAAQSRSARTKAAGPAQGGRFRASTGRCCAAHHRARATPSPPRSSRQRRLGLTAPSLYDLRNFVPGNVEEARHLWRWSTSYRNILAATGREEAEDLLRRARATGDSPRLLGAFNESNAGTGSRFSVHLLHRPATARCSCTRWRNRGSTPVAHLTALC